MKDTHPHCGWLGRLLRRPPLFDPECRTCVMAMLSDRAQRGVAR